MKLYFFIKVQHTGDTDLGQADIEKDNFTKYGGVEKRYLGAG